MNGFKIIALIILVVGLAHDYRKDSGQHKKAKVYQAIFLAVMCLAYSGTLGNIGWMVTHFADARQKFGVAVGYVPGEIHWLFYLGHLVLALIALVTACQLISRSEAARKRLLLLLPYLAFAETFAFYRGWLSADDGTPLVPLMHGFVVVLGLFINLGLAVAMRAVYRSEFMRAFYHRPLVPAAMPATLAFDANAHEASV